MENHEAVQAITACEEELLDAFQKKDVERLDRMIHESAMFVLPNGHAVNKATLLQNYRTGNMAIAVITCSDRTISMMQDTAVVTMVLELSGTYWTEAVNDRFRYLRVWKQHAQRWQAIATVGVLLPS